MVYVLNKNNKPLMPCKEVKARKLLRDNKAKVVNKLPFTIQLLWNCEENTQEINLGVDAGSKHIGLSATTKDKVLFEADVELRNNITKLLASKKQARRTRRNRKTRYRKARFNNRVYSKHKGWLAPSIEQKINCHLIMIEKLHKILPITKIIVEVASFDIQKIKKLDIQGKEYQQGEQLGFWNVREYVLFRDRYTCQCCKGNSKDNVLNVHHIESRKTGGNASNNLVTLCETCHTNYHKGLIELPKSIKRGKSFRDSAFMGVMRWTFYNRLKELYSDISMTYGYITKNTRIRNNLPKEHYIDARCISKNPNAKSDGKVFYYKKVRRHNRRLYQDKIYKGGKRKRNICPYELFGFHTYDLVKWQNRLYYVSSLRRSGIFVIKDLLNKNFKKELTYRKLNKFKIRSGYIIS